MDISTIQPQAVNLYDLHSVLLATKNPTFVSEFTQYIRALQEHAAVSDVLSVADFSKLLGEFLEDRAQDYADEALNDTEFSALIARLRDEDKRSRVLIGRLSC
jgi:hypothetical protein